jgi:hypothetical protein
MLVILNAAIHIMRRGYSPDYKPFAEIDHSYEGAYS